MFNWIKKISKNYYSFLDKKYTKIIIEYTLIAWTIFTFLLYSYNYNHFNIVITLSLTIILLLIISIFVCGPKAKINGESLYKTIKKITKKENIFISIKSSIFIFALFAIAAANFLFAIFSDINYKLLSLYFLYFLFSTSFLVFLYVKIKKTNLSGIIIKLKKYFTSDNGHKLFTKLTVYFFIIFFSLSALLYFFPECEYAKIIASNNFLFYEFNIIQKLLSIIFFYALFFLLIYAVGRKILKIFKLNLSSRPEQFIFSVGLGSIPIMFGAFFISLLGILYSWAIWIMAFLLFLFSFSELRQTAKEINSYKFNLTFKDKFSSFKSTVLIGLFILLTFNFVAITKPIPTTTDDLHTYFNVPKLLTDYGEYRTHNSGVSNMGQNTEMIYAAIMSITNSQYIIHFQFIFFTLCLLGFYLFFKKIFGEKYAVFGLLTIYFVPWNAYYASTAKVEFLLSFYLLLVIYSFFLWRKENKNYFLYLLGIFSGISLGIKYNAALLLIPVFLAVVITLIKKYKITFKALKPFIATSFLALLFFSPWAIKNQFYFNNVFYPFEYITSNSINQDLINSNKFYEKETIKELNYLRHSVQYDKFSILNPIKTFWNHSIGKTAKGGWVNFGFIPLLIIPFYFFKKNKKEFNVLLSVVLLYILLWYIIEGARPWYVFFGFLLLYSLLPSLFSSFKKFTILYLIISFIVFIANFNLIVSNIYYLPGKIDKKEYISRAIPYYKTANYINNLNLKSNEKIFLVEDMVLALIDRNDELIIVDPYLIMSSYALSKGEKFYHETLKQSSISYIMQSKRKEKAFLTWVNNKNISLNEYTNNRDSKTPSIYENINTLNAFLKNYTTEIFDDGYYALYKLN